MRPHGAAAATDPKRLHEGTALLRPFSLAPNCTVWCLKLPTWGTPTPPDHSHIPFSHHWFSLCSGCQNLLGVGVAHENAILVLPSEFTILWVQVGPGRAWPMGSQCSRPRTPLVEVLLYVVPPDYANCSLPGLSPKDTVLAPQCPPFPHHSDWRTSFPRGPLPHTSGSSSPHWGLCSRALAPLHLTWPGWDCCFWES